MRKVFSIFLFIAVTGCASGMSKEECLYADWRAIGYEDGAAGRDAAAIGSRRVACADKAKVTTDMEAYLRGREHGLWQFCRPANGFDYGARGGRYAGACQGRDEGLFVAAYEKGLKLYGLTSSYEAASRALAKETSMASLRILWQPTAMAVAAATLLAGCGPNIPSSVKIGVALPLSGPSAARGQDLLNGVKLAVTELNASGYKIAGKPV